MLTASNYLRGLRTQEWQCVRVCVGSTYAVVVPLPHSLPLSLALLAINGTCSVRNIKKKSAAGARPDQAHCRGKRERVRNGMGGAHTPTESRRRNKQKNESKFTTHTHTHTQLRPRQSVGNGDSWIINSARALRFFPLHRPLPLLFLLTPLLCCCSAELTLTLFVVCLGHTQKNRLRLFIKPTKKRWENINHICFLAAYSVESELFGWTFPLCQYQTHMLVAEISEIDKLRFSFVVRVVVLRCGRSIIFFAIYFHF